MPEDSIMDLVDNVESLYNRKAEVFDRWMAEGDAWNKSLAQLKALRMAERFAREVKEMGLVTGRYKKSDLRQFADEMLAEFEEHRDYQIKVAVERSRTPQPPEPMTPEAVEHAEKYEELARKIGIDVLQQLIPAPPEKIRKALETGDPHLNTVPLRHWDAAAAAIQIPGLSLSEKVCALKHVATWHYA